jgi:hypothetical protein
MPATPQPAFLKSKDKKYYSIDVNEDEIELEKIDYDPEATKSELARRPMLLTHSLMMGLSLILIFAVISIIVQKVSAKRLDSSRY